MSHVKMRVQPKPNFVANTVPDASSSHALSALILSIPMIFLIPTTPQITICSQSTKIKLVIKKTRNPSKSMEIQRRQTIT